MTSAPTPWRVHYPGDNHTDRRTSLKTRHTIRAATAEDRSAVKNVAVATGLFRPHELDTLDGMLTGYFDGTLEGHRWIVLDSRGVVGAAYYAPEMMTDGTWNLYFIGILPEQQGNGHGRALLAAVEQALRRRGERVLIVETSGLDNFEPTRQFYRKNGYDEEARIREFYGPGDDKVVFWKSLRG